MEGQTETFEGGTALSPTSTVEISISCRDLADKDLLSKSDPMCVVFHRPRRSTHWVEFMRTEVIDNNLNPDFVTKAIMDYHFEMQQNLRFEVYDIDKPTSKLMEHDSIGYMECTLAQIVSAGALGYTTSLVDMETYEDSPSKSVKSPGMIILIAEELSALKDEMHLTLGATSIGSSSFICFPPKTFYTISKSLDTGKYVLVHRSERKRGRNPEWTPVVLPLSSLCAGDKERKLKIECFQETFTGSEKSIGFCITNLNKLAAIGNGGLRLSASDGRDIRSTLMIHQFKIAKIYTFVDYIQSGTQIHCCFSIDFTSSNGDPSEPSSLHHFSPQANRPNPYEQAIQAVGNIIQDYDNTKMFPCYGFGARIPPVGEVSHNFFVSLGKTPQCFGIHGVLETYSYSSGKLYLYLFERINCIRQIQLYGPTNFAPVIRHVAEMALECKDGEEYYVLIIITDGVITDMPQTKEAIVAASSLPLSIIIIGVGGADFDAMEELDGDSVRISYNGRVAERDIVQFVPYRDAYSWLATTSGPTSGTGSWSNENSPDFTNRFAQSQLAAEVLAEIPDQLTSFMKSKGIIPSIVSRAPSPVPVSESQANLRREENPATIQVQHQLRPPTQVFPSKQQDPEDTNKIQMLPADQERQSSPPQIKVSDLLPPAPEA
ncbi:unnamed protein product [Allacma fusca]|uniref:C2 domain-containing protein n=1 Tax=Allacma fusca TaxID=39272 RepID=A0A8J2K8P9_9HEXA|nr:unnamed protein product [Allacma fusca]